MYAPLVINLTIYIPGARNSPVQNECHSTVSGDVGVPQVLGKVGGEHLRVETWGVRTSYIAGVAVGSYFSA